MEKGLAWTSQEAPSSFLCHPSNRGGLMLSWHDCHDKGSSIVSLGADATKLSQSVAFELATNPVTKAQQVKSNQDLVEASQGKLAPLSGQESVVAKVFCVAVPLMSHGFASLCNHHLSLGALFRYAQDEAFQAMCLQGWSWTIVSQSVEVAIPDLPILVQASLNTDHVVSSKK